MFELDAPYNRIRDIHDVYGGQRQGGISTPNDSEFIFLFTGEAGEKHGYRDEVTDEGYRLYGEGQIGDMAFVRGNRAIRDHVHNGKRLLLFQATGKGRPYIFRGEHELIRYEEVDGTPDTLGNLRKAIVFVLRPAATDNHASGNLLSELPDDELFIGATSQQRLQEVRTKQALFRRRVQLVERGCRVTGITDPRFLRASHIKPWSHSTTVERVDGHNGLLLAPHVDHLFDGGWIAFDDRGQLLRSPLLPENIVDRLGLGLRKLPGSTNFSERQLGYLQFHRHAIFKST